MNDVTLLIDLDRVNTAVGTRIAVVANRAQEALIDALDAVSKDIREANKNRKFYPPRPEVFGELVQIYGPFRLWVRTHLYLPRVVDREVRRTPALHLVKERTFGGSPGTVRRTFDYPLLGIVGINGKLVPIGWLRFGGRRFGSRRFGSRRFGSR